MDLDGGRSRPKRGAGARAGAPAILAFFVTSYQYHHRAVAPYHPYSTKISTNGNTYM